MNLHELRLADDRDRGAAYGAFARVVAERQLSAGVSVGVRFGGLAEATLELEIVDELLGLDAFDVGDRAGNPLNLSNAELENLFWYVMGRLSRFGPRYNHVRGSSSQGAAVLNVELDFVHLDADNSARVATDLPLWFPKVRAGGVIGGTAWSRVRAAVEPFFGPQATARITAADGDVWWVQKDV